MHPEAMLLIDHNEAEIVELDSFLKQRMGADHHLCCAAGNGRQLAAALRHLEFAGEPAELDTQRLQPFAKVEAMLFGKDFGGRHNRRLLARRYRCQRRQCRHHRLAAADIALHQAQHGNRFSQVIGDFTHHPALGAGQVKPQTGKKPLLQGGIQLQTGSAISLGFAAQQ